MLQAGWVGAAQGRYLPLVGRGSICMLMPVRHPAAWLAGIIWRPRLATICIQACSIHCLHCCHAGKCGTLLLPGWPAPPSAFAASLLNQHMLTLEMPYIEQCLVVLLIILMLKGIGVMQGVLRPRIPGDEPTFVFPKIKRAFLVHVLIGTFWLGRIIIFRPFCSDFSRARPQCAYKRGGAGK